MNILSKTDNVTNNVTNISTTNILSQENQEYYNRWDQQYIARKYNGGLELVTLELVPVIILEEEEKDVFNQWANNNDQLDNISYTPVKKTRQGAPTSLMLTTVFSTSQNQNKTEKLRQEL